MKELTCIVCPNSCNLSIEQSEGGWNITGQLCKRGEDFALDEMTNPVRTICSTVATTFSQVPVVPVRMSKDIPKNRIFDVMKEINNVIVDRPVKCGDVLAKDLLGLGADLIVTSSILFECAEGAKL